MVNLNTDDIDSMAATDRQRIVAKTLRTELVNSIANFERVWTGRTYINLAKAVLHALDDYTAGREIPGELQETVIPVGPAIRLEVFRGLAEHATSWDTSSFIRRMLAIAAAVEAGKLPEPAETPDQSAAIVDVTPPYMGA